MVTTEPPGEGLKLEKGRRHDAQELIRELNRAFPGVDESACEEAQARIGDTENACLGR